MKEQTAAVQRMQDYIEEHLEADITLAELSAVSLFSPWHSCRLIWTYSTDAFMGKEQNRANARPPMSAGKQIVIFIFYGKIGNKKDCIANSIDKNGNYRI